MKAQNMTTNVGKKVFVPVETSVRTITDSIMPERFSSISMPTGISLVAPELASVSAARVSSQNSTESR